MPPRKVDAGGGPLAIHARRSMPDDGGLHERDEMPELCN